MTNQIKHILILCLGWIFVVLGIVGFFLPFFQGVLFLFIGIMLLSVSSKWTRSKIEQFLLKHPQFSEHHARADRIIKKIFRLNP